MKSLATWFQELYGATATAFIQFFNTVGVGGGGIDRISKTGITSVTDAGAAGIPPITYDPVNNIAYLGNTTNSVSAQSGAVGITTGGATRLYFSNTLNQIIGNPTTADSWLLAKGVHSSLNLNDCPPKTEIPGAGGAIAWINGRGGLKRLTAVIAGGDTYQHNNSCDWISLQDAPRLYSRWTAQQWNAGVPDSFQAVGWRDWANNNSIWWQWDAAVVGGTITIRANRAGATTIHDTGIAAVAGAFHIYEFISTAAGVVSCYIDGTLVHTLAAAENPAVTTLMEEWEQSTVIAPAILSQLDLDIARTVLSRNTGAAP